MSRKPIILVVSGIAALVVAGLWPDDVPDTPTSTDQPQTTSAASHANSARPDAVETDHEIPSEPERAALEPGDFQVFGRAVQFITGDRCDGEGRCRQEPVPLHAYAEYPDEQLRTLAEFDGGAAIVLANRLGASNREQARHYAARGFVLTGDPYAFHMTQQLSGVSRGARYDSNGTFDLRAAQRAYVWIKIGYELGISDGASLAYQASVLNDNGYTNLEPLDALADATRKDVEQARLQLVGEGFE